MAISEKKNNLDAEQSELFTSILKNAKELDNLTTGALVAFVGGSFVVGIVLSKLAWIPFAMSSPVLGYRSLLAYADLDRRKQAEKIERMQDTLIFSEKISNSSLPQEQKNLFFEQIPKLIEPSNSKQLNLPPSKNTFPQILDDKGNPINERNED